MAIYHCTCKVISRGQGRSAVGAAAYRSGTEIVNEYDGLVHDYTSKGGVVHSEVMLCANAPAEYADRAVLWNAVERVEKSAKAQLCREYEMALPRELTPEERVAFVRDFIKKNFTDKGMIADFSIHDKGDGNPHVHILLTMRPIEKDGSWGDKQKKEYILDKHGNKQYDKKKKTYKCKTVKTTDWDSKDTLSRNREAWAAAVNTALKAKGIAERVDHRSLEAQGIDRVPTVHEGAARAKRRKDIRKFKKGLIPVLPELPHSLAVNAEARRTNVEIGKIEKEISALDRIIGQIKADGLWLGLYEKINDILERANSARHIAQLQRVCLGELYRMQLTGFEYIINNPLMKYHAQTYCEDKTPYLTFHRKKATNDLTATIAELENNIKSFDDGKKYIEQDAHSNWWDYPRYLRYEYIPVVEEQAQQEQPAPVVTMEAKVEPVAPAAIVEPQKETSAAPAALRDLGSGIMKKWVQEHGEEAVTFTIPSDKEKIAFDAVVSADRDVQRHAADVGRLQEAVDEEGGREVDYAFIAVPKRLRDATVTLRKSLDTIDAATSEIKNTAAPQQPSFFANKKKKKQYDVDLAAWRDKVNPLYEAREQAKENIDTTLRFVMRYLRPEECIKQGYGFDAPVLDSDNLNEKDITYLERVIEFKLTHQLGMACGAEAVYAKNIEELALARKALEGAEARFANEMERIPPEHRKDAQKVVEQDRAERRVRGKVVSAVETEKEKSKQHKKEDWGD